MKAIASDYWKPYEHIIPEEKHIQSKAETFTVEGYNSLFRHFFSKNEKKIKMLFQESRNAQNLCTFINALPKRNIIYT